MYFSLEIKLEFMKTLKHATRISTMILFLSFIVQNTVSIAKSEIYLNYEVPCLTGVISLNIKITDKNDHLLEGVHVKLIQDGKVISETTSEANEKTILSVFDYNQKPVTFELSKEGYKTYRLTNVIAEHDGKYSFMLTEGEGVEEHEIKSRVNKNSDENKKQSCKEKRLNRVESRLENRLEKIQDKRNKLK